MSFRTGKVVKRPPPALVAQENYWHLLPKTPRWFAYDTPPLQTQEEQNDMLFDDFARLYSAQTDPKHLNAMRMVLTIAKFVFLNRYNQDVLASCFFDRTPAQAHELGEQLCRLYWNGDPKYQKGFLDHLMDVYGTNRNEANPKELMNRYFYCNNNNDSKDDDFGLGRYHFVFTKRPVKFITAAVIRKIWGALQFEGKQELSGIVCGLEIPYLRLIRPEAKKRWENRRLELPKLFCEWMEVVKLDGSSV